MKYPPMKCETIRDRGNGDEVTIHVTHHVAQSWSKAVDPRAMKEARQTLPRDGRQWALLDTDYGVETIGDMCRSVYYFAPASTVARVGGR